MGPRQTMRHFTPLKQNCCCHGLAGLNESAFMGIQKPEGIEQKVFKKLGITGSYQYGFKRVLPIIKNTYATNNKKLSKLIHQDLALYKYPIN